MWIRRHLVMSAKAAIAATIAWLLVQQLGGVADEYPYYAPLGAVIAVTSTVAGSVRESVQSVAAILAGAALALGVQAIGLPTLVGLALVVGIGTALTTWRGFGNQASYLPISALFVLIIGGGNAMDYAIAYLGLTGMGALVGIALNIAFPPMALTPMADSIHRLRELLADQLDQLSDGLSQESPLTLEEWHERQRLIRPTAEEMQRVVTHATEGHRANWRARRWNATAEQAYQQARALQQVTFLIEDIAAIVVDHERAELENVALGPELRPYAARALDEMAAVLRSVEQDTADPAALRTADEAVADLVARIREVRHESASDMFAAGTIVTGVRRAMASLVPPDLRSDLPSAW